jgi:hypothetical protein
LQQAADASKITLKKAAQNILDSLQATGSSVQKHLPPS